MRSENFISYRWYLRVARLLLGAASIGVLAMGTCVLVSVLSHARSEHAPHPAFWAKRPRAGQNNVWYVNQNADTVLVFVHGIFSDSRGCWSREEGMQSQYWPELISTDDRLEHPSIFLGGYATSIDGGPYDTRQAAGELRDALKREGVLNRKRIIFIAHSLGGIVVRFLLVHNQDLFRGKMLGLVLYASPSLGAALANDLSALSRFYGNKLSGQLQRENTFLTELDKDFRDLLYNPNSDPSSLRILGAEGVETFFIVHHWFCRDRRTVVPEDSASRYFGAPVYLRSTDHFSTVKPDTKEHPGHQLLLTFYEKFQNEYGAPRPLAKNYVSVSTDRDQTLGQIVEAVKNKRNVTITFGPSCAASLKRTVIEKGDHDGNDMKEFLENLRQRVKGSEVSYHVQQKGERRYEIMCP